MFTKSSSLPSVRFYYQIYQKDISKRLFQYQDYENKIELSKHIF